jgi:hypothetical protein
LDSDVIVPNKDEVLFVARRGQALLFTAPPACRFVAGRNGKATIRPLEHARQRLPASTTSTSLADRERRDRRRRRHRAWHRDT